MHCVGPGPAERPGVQGTVGPFDLILLIICDTTIKEVNINAIIFLLTHVILQIKRIVNKINLITSYTTKQLEPQDNT